MGASGFDGFADDGTLVAGQVVHDDHVAASEVGHENLSDIGLEPVAVDRAIEHHRRDHAGHAQASDQCGRLAMAMRITHPQPLATSAAAMTAGHVGRRPCLVDEDEPRRVEVELAIEPVLARTQDVGAILLDRVAGLFLRVIP